MCGVAGVFAYRIDETDERLVHEIVADQLARGPDVQAVHRLQELGAGAVLGHDRLSIIDLTPGGNQPMTTADGRYHVVFNGEIYNYLELRDELRAAGQVFHTESDTEVLLAAWATWGQNCLDRLNGMFAFGLFDVRESVLWLVRDRFGVKPLFYALDTRRAVFASTPKVMARVLRRRPNLGYVARGLAYWLYEDDGDLTQYEGVQSVPPGCVVQLRLAGALVQATLSRYYDIRARASSLRHDLASLSNGQLTGRLLETLGSAVALRLRSDVPVGLSLSGGLDSPSVSALARAQHAGLVGLTYGAPDEPLSEGPVVAEIARHIALRMVYLPSASDDVLAEHFWATLEAQDAPFVGMSVVAQHAIFRATHAAGIRVLLGGQGGDEAFMGYHKFRVFQLRHLLATGRPVAALTAALELLPVLTRLPLSASMLRRQWQRYRGHDGMHSLAGFGDPAPLDLGHTPTRPLWERQHLDIVRLSLPTLLRYEDRNSMGNSVESRLPFLDYRIMELGLALPDAAKLRGGQGKWILREAMAGRLPDAVRFSRIKRGFDTNHAHAIARGLGMAIRNRLTASRQLLAPFLGTAQVGLRYGDERLTTDPVAMAEAISLLWLAGRL